jgi:PhzF family phenazine biosynthesis protein
MVRMPSRVPYLLVDAFTERPGAGNRAGVVLEAGGLSPAQMQRAAAALGVSETVFVTRRDGESAWVRYYTPTQEVEFCGHATVALGFALAARALLGGEAALETLAGRVPLAVEYEAGSARRVWMRQAEPRFRPLPPEARPALAEALGVDARTVHRGLPMAAASTGLWSAFVPLIDAGILDALEPDLEVVEALSAAWGVSSVHPYAATSPSSFAARDFAPLVGIPEDPVTGSASGALAALLARAGALPRRGAESEVRFSQGHAMGLPGEAVAVVEYENDRPARVRVGGCAVAAEEGALEL